MNGAAVQARRLGLGLSREQLARQCGIDSTTVLRIELGRRPNTTVATLCRLARALKVTPGELLLPDCGEAA